VLSLRVAPNVAILMGADDVKSARIVPVPGSERRVVAMFHVERLSGRDKI